MIIIKPPAKVRTKRGVLIARSIVLSKQKGLYLVTDAVDPGNKPLIGELLHLFGRSDRLLADQHYSTLDTAVRQSLEIDKKNVQRRRWLEADMLVASSIAAVIVPEWRTMSREQVKAIKAILNELADQLQNARNPSLVSAAERVSATKDLRDSTGRPNPLIVQTRLLRALRDFELETILSEQVRLSTNDRLQNAIELTAEINHNIKLLFDFIDDNADEKIIRAQLSMLAIKPYYFAVGFAETLFNNGRLYAADKKRLKKAFDYEASLITVSETLSVLSEDFDSYDRLKIVFESFGLPRDIESSHYSWLHTELTRELANLEAAMRLRAHSSQAEQVYIGEQIDRHIKSFKEQIRYRDW